MPNISGLITAVSDDVVAKLAAGGYPPLTDGQIVVGRVRIPENSVPPRIIFVPKSSAFGAKDPSTRAPVNPGLPIRRAALTNPGAGYTSAPTVTFTGVGASGSGATATATVVNGVVTTVNVTANGSGYVGPVTVTLSGGGGSGAAASAILDLPADWRLIVQQRSVATDEILFQVHCWGANYADGVLTPDPNGGDFDFTQVLYQQVIASTHDIAAGAYKLHPGAWLDASPSTTQLEKLGSWFTFGLSFRTPVLDVSLSYVPTGTVSQSTVTVNESAFSGDPVVVSP